MTKEERLRLLELIIDNIYNGVVITDPDGKIIYFNKPYGQFLGVNPEEMIGKDVRQVIENTRMHIVAQTGVPEINKAHNIKGQDMVVQRIPIKDGDKVVAVYGQVMFKNVSDVSKLAKELSYLQSKLKLYEEELLSLRAERYTFDSIIGKSAALLALKDKALKAGNTGFPVLITGESGTGKEMFAQAIHNASSRRLQPFVRINCASIPKDLLESELFGYEKGAFTGAQNTGKHGKVELANKGTLFLDEIGDMPLEMQPKLLRVLEEKEFERIGGTTPLKSDFRLIAASNQPLEDMVDKGQFRKDLFYRLNVIRLHIPPLRERKEDIVPIAERVLSDLSKDFGRTFKLSKESIDLLLEYDWPGNTRELVNVLNRVVCFTDNDIIQPYELPLFLRRKDGELKGIKEPSLEVFVDKAEREAILRALDNAGGNKTKAAKILNIHRTLLYRKMRKYSINFKKSKER